MHIVHVSPVVYLDRLAFSYELGHAQVDRGHRVSVVGWNECDRSLQVHLMADGLRVYLLPGINFSLPRLIPRNPLILKLSRFLNEIDLDVIHLQSHLNPTALKTVMLKMPVVTTVHGLLAKYNSLIDIGQRAYLFTLGNVIFKKSRRVIALTRSDAKMLVKFGCPADRIRIIPNGVDISLFQPKSEEDGLVVWHGRFVPQKGLEYLIGAAKKVLDKHDNARFVLIGDGPLRTKVMALTERIGLRKRISFVGHLPTIQQVAGLLFRASVYALPSLREGMPWALLEAMSCGKPVVGSDISGINDIISHEENGLLVPSRNPTALADAILRLLRDEDLRRSLGSKARHLMVERYSWDRIADRVEKVYNEAIQETN